MSKKARVQLVVDGKNNAGPAFKQADNQLERFSAGAKKAGLALLGAFSVSAVASFVKESALATAQMVRMAELSGTTAQKFQTWAFASRTMGIEQDKLGDIFKDVRDKVGDFLQTGGGPLADFFENIAPQVGVTAEQFRELSGPDALQLYVKSLEQANVSQNEMTFYMEAIASDAALLLPLLRDNGAEYQRLAEQARELGLVMSDDVVEGAKAFERSANTLGAVSQGVGQQITSELLPSMNQLTGLLADVSREGQTATQVANVLGFVMKVLASAVIIVGDGFGALGRFIGGTAAAAAAVASGELSQAADIMRMVGEDNARNTGIAMDRVRKLWDSSYQSVGETVTRVAGEVEASSERMENAVVTSSQAIKDAYKKLVDDAKEKLSELKTAEREANRDVEKFRDERLEIEKRYADALAQLQGGAGGASYGAAQALKLNARQSLAGGDFEGAQRQAQQALEMLLELERAGENTYGFTGFAKELQQIELEANRLQQTDADKKLASITAELERVKELASVEVKPFMPPEAIEDLRAKVVALGMALGKEMVITPTLNVPEAPASAGWTPIPGSSGSGIPGHATGTPSAAPGLAWVGERGPELVAFGGGERVFTADASRRLASVLSGLRESEAGAGLTDAALAGAANDFSSAALIQLPGGRSVPVMAQRSGLEELADFARLSRLKKG